jgi:aspartate aminotransferase
MLSTTRRALANRIQSVGLSETTRVFALARQLIRQDREVINLAVGEPDFGTPPAVVEATRQALTDGETRYGDVSGLTTLRSRLAQGFRDFGHENIIVTNGAKQGLYALFQVLLNPEDEVILSKPFWVSFAEQIKLAGGIPVFVNTKDHRIDPERIAQAVTKRTRAILINSPNNPTGAVYTRAELQAVAAIAENCNCWLIADEAYHVLTYDGCAHVPIVDLAGDPNRVITVRSFSKHYNMTGFRLGYVAAAVEVIETMAGLQSHLCGNVCSFAQRGALAALEMDQSVVDGWRGKLQQRRNLAFGRAVEMFDCVKPDGAFYLFPDITSHLRPGETSADFALRLLNDGGVAVVPGEAFGVPNHIRIFFGISETTLNSAFERIKSIL